jgi:IS30 family transposase
MPRTYSHLSYEQRLRVKGLLDKGTKKVDIARALGVHNATIYREIDRGSINGMIRAMLRNNTEAIYPKRDDRQFALFLLSWLSTLQC